jgi:putative ABC transport system ATP-binding protein
MSGEVVMARGLTRVYQEEAVPVHALRVVDFSLSSSEFVSLSGPSGSGKSTLLNIVGGLDRQDEGIIELDGEELAPLSEGDLAALRLRKIGFVFQAYNLVPVLSALENVEFILQLQGVGSAERKERAGEALKSLGLSELQDRRPGEMSGGQQQRVAIARAIVTNPVLLLADEPSANLDSETTKELMELLRNLNETQGMTIITATHDPMVMGYAKRQVHLRDGTVERDEVVTD